MKATPASISQTLVDLRKQSALTQVAAAERAEISRSRLAAIERGQSANLELNTLQKLLDAYGAELHIETRTPRRTLNQILRDSTLD